MISPLQGCRATGTSQIGSKPHGESVTSVTGTQQALQRSVTGTERKGWHDAQDQQWLPRPPPMVPGSPTQHMKGRNSTRLRSPQEQITPKTASIWGAQAPGEAGRERRRRWVPPNLPLAHLALPALCLRSHRGGLQRVPWPPSTASSTCPCPQGPAAGSPSLLPPASQFQPVSGPPWPWGWHYSLFSSQTVRVHGHPGCCASQPTGRVLPRD